VLGLTPTPPANAFVSASERHKAQDCFPLDVFFCKSCGHVQLLDVVDPRLLFEHYVYVSGTSPVFVRHFQEYAADIVRRYSPAADALVVDIGSNDGTLLSFFKAAGCRVLGIDPAQEIAADATARGIETVAAFFTPQLAERLVTERGQAKIVTANNVFAHADDLHGIAKGVAALLAPDGVFVFEVSYLADVVEKTLFDTIYHEHVAYHALAPLIPFLRSHGLEVVEAIRVDPHGGSLRVIAALVGGPHRPGDSVAALLSSERDMGLGKIETFYGFAARIKHLKTELSAVLRDIKTQGKTIAAFGAPAKATTLMYHFGIGPQAIDYVIDDSPLKQGLFTPGMHIPVVGGAALAERKPDYLLLLAWNFAEPIIAKNRAYLDGGGHFIVPLPKLRVV